MRGERTRKTGFKASFIAHLIKGVALKGHTIDQINFLYQSLSKKIYKYIKGKISLSYTSVNMKCLARICDLRSCKRK